MKEILNSERFWSFVSIGIFIMASIGVRRGWLSQDVADAVALVCLGGYGGGKVAGSKKPVAQILED